MLCHAQYLVLVVEYPDSRLVSRVATTSFAEEQAPLVENIMTIRRTGSLHEVRVHVCDLRHHHQAFLLALRDGGLRRFKQLITCHEIGCDLIGQLELFLVVLACQLLNSALFGGSRFLMGDRDVFEMLLDNLKILALLCSIDHSVVRLAPRGYFL